MCNIGAECTASTSIRVCHWHAFCLLLSTPHLLIVICFGRSKYHPVYARDDVNYGPFKSSFHINLEVITPARINDEKPISFAPHVVALFVFGGMDHVRKAVAPRNVFQDGFSHDFCLKAWAKVGAAPITRACLSNPKVRRELGDSEDDLN